MTDTHARTGYAAVNGLEMYYEIHGTQGFPLGSGTPLVLLHGWFSTVNTDFGGVLSPLSATRQVIGVEQQAHGHTADIDRPLSYEQMADDTAALLRHLNIERADLFGYSMGGDIALQVAHRHPNLARKVVFAGGTSYSAEGLYPELRGMEEMKPEQLAEHLAGTPWQQAYARVAPNPEDWITLITKKIEADRKFTGWRPEDIQSLKAPALLMIGDSDIVRPEHTVEMFRLLGGGVLGDFYGLPKSRLAVLPGTTHVTIMHRTDWLVSMIIDFLDGPTPDDNPNPE